MAILAQPSFLQSGALFKGSQDSIGDEHLCCVLEKYDQTTEVKDSHWQWLRQDIGQEHSYNDGGGLELIDAISSIKTEEHLDSRLAVTA